MKSVLQTRGLTVSFGGLKAVNNISLEVREGEIFGLLGPNGAGKTTLLNMIAGVTPPTAGSVLFEKQDITKLPIYKRARIGIGRTFQITQPFVGLTVLENVIIGGMLRERRRHLLIDWAEELLDYVGLSEKRDALAESLSTGQRKRLELARALATRPKLLLMDEVTGGVDQPSIPGLVGLVAALAKKGIAIVVIEHNMQIISEICHRVLFMHNGTAMDTGPSEKVLSNPSIVELYLGGDEEC